MKIFDLKTTLPALLLIAVLLTGTAAAFTGGTGTQDGPERIEDIDEIMQEELGYRPDPEAVTIYKVFDYDCPHCRELTPRLERLKENYGDEVEVFYIPYPVMQREMGSQAAIATLCADQYDRGSEFVSLMVENWSGMDSQQIGQAHDEFEEISADEWQQCLTDDAVRNTQNNIISLGRRLNIRSVPTTIVDGYVITGGIDYQTLERLVELVK